MKYIRQANRLDISRIAEILIFTKRMNYRVIFRNDAVSFGEMQVLSLAEKLLKNDEFLNYWVYDDEFVKGVVHIDGDQITELYVDCFFENKGIGSRLIEFAIQEKKASRLWVLEKNLRAISFYKRHGFVISGDRKLQEGTTEYVVRMIREI